MFDDDNDNDNDYDKYYGFADSRSQSRTSKPIMKKNKQYFKKQPETTNIAMNPSNNSYEYTEQDVFEENDEFIDEEIVEDENNNRQIYEEVYDEDDDNYLSNAKKKEVKIVKKHIDEEIYDEQRDNDRINVSSQPQIKQYTRVQPHYNNQMFDLSLYTLSGVIIIFMMEQFVQLGIKIKTYS